MLRLVLATFLSLAVTLGEARETSTLPQTDIAELSVLLAQSTRPLVFSSELSTNGQNAIRGVVAMAEAEGIDQIRRLLDTSALEEQWVFLPEPQIWIEIGVGEVDDRVEVDVDFLERVLGAFDTVHLYHIHPARYFEPGGSDTLALALPSPSDVESSVKIAKLQQALSPGSEVRSFVVSPLGVVEYAPTPLGRSRLVAEATHPRASVERDLMTMISVRRSVFNVTRTIAAEPEAGSARIIENLCTQLSTEFFNMRFTPAAEVRGDRPAALALVDQAPN
jgi:hypothetical protein